MKSWITPWRLEYPREKLEIIVISDASDDNTDEIVRNKIESDHRIRLIRQQQRKGKTAGINLAVQDARGEILIFSDANAIYRKDALYELVKYFKNPQVGYVVGAAVYSQDADSFANQSETAYWNRELTLKQLESDFYSVVGGDGAIYAVRKKLFLPLQDDDISDFANPLQVVAGGYKGVFNSRAVCYEDSADNFAKEYRRKRRIVNRSLRSVLKYIKNFDLIHHRKFLFMLISHKVLRWFGMFFIHRNCIKRAGAGFKRGGVHLQRQPPRHRACRSFDPGGETAQSKPILPQASLPSLLFLAGEFRCHAGHFG